MVVPRACDELFDNLVGEGGGFGRRGEGVRGKNKIVVCDRGRHNVVRAAESGVKQNDLAPRGIQEMFLQGREIGITAQRASSEKILKQRVSEGNASAGARVQKIVPAREMFVLRELSAFGRKRDAFERAGGKFGVALAREFGVHVRVEQCGAARGQRRDLCALRHIERRRGVGRVYAHTCSHFRRARNAVRADDGQRDFFGGTRLRFAPSRGFVHLKQQK